MSPYHRPCAQTWCDIHRNFFWFPSIPWQWPSVPYHFMLASHCSSYLFTIGFRILISEPCPCLFGPGGLHWLCPTVMPAIFSRYAICALDPNLPLYSSPNSSVHTVPPSTPVASLSSFKFCCAPPAEDLSTIYSHWSHHSISPPAFCCDLSGSRLPTHNPSTGASSWWFLHCFHRAAFWFP